MNLLATDQTAQNIIWGLGIVEIILALYVFSLNVRRSENLHVSALFGLFAINSLAIGWLIGAQNAAQANLPAALLATTTPIFTIALLITAVVLIKKEWLQGGGRWFWWLLYAITFVPILLTISDWFFDQQIWFIRLNPASYSGGFVALSEFTSSTLAPFRYFILIGVPILSLLPLGYLAFRDKELTFSQRRLSRILFGTLVFVILSQVIVSNMLGSVISSLLASLTYFLAFAYANFSEIVLGRQIQGGRLQPRLTALLLSIAVPLFFAGIAFVSIQANHLLRQAAREKIAAISATLGSNVNTWLDLNITALEDLVTSTEIMSMNPDRQEPLLVSMANAYTHMYLVSTTDTSGINVARSDTAELTDYSDRSWYREIIAGEPIVFQTLIGRTSGEPALVVSMPIREFSGRIIGVGMFASDLNDISSQISLGKIGVTGQIFVIDAENKVVAHTNPNIANELTDLSTDPVVSAFRNAEENNLAIQFPDQDGEQWLAYAQALDYGWGVVVEVPDADVLASARIVQARAGIVLVGGIFILVVLVALTIRQALGPIESLTETASAIAEGDYGRVAPIESQDEIGFMATTFNRMTERLLEAISGLELRVAARTRNLQDRTSQLQAATDVGQAAFSILDADQLIQEVVELIRDRFGLYFVGLFITDPLNEWALLQAGTGTAGQAMLARQHRIKLGEGMIGWCIANGQARIALEVGSDAYRMATSELPDTRSEAAIPLRSRGQVIGAITVQSTQPEAFDEAAIAVLQTMADMVGVAIDNARLYTESDQALEATRRAYGEVSQSAWANIFVERPEISFRSDRSGASSVQTSWSPEMEMAWQKGKTVQLSKDAERYTLLVPIKVRDIVLGVISTYKPNSAGAWTEDEIHMIENITAQMGVVLDSARLYRDTQKRATSERLIGEMTTQMRETLNIDTILQTTVREIKNALNLSEAEIWLSAEKSKES